MMPTVTFQPSGDQVEVEEEASLLDASIQADETSVVCCGIDPSCGACRLAVHEGLENLTPPDQLEADHHADEGFLPFERLGCMARILGDVVVEVYQ